MTNPDTQNMIDFVERQTGYRVAVDVVSGMAIKYPEDEAEQQRIASCLSSLDALITAGTQKHEALKTHKKGLMQHLFPSPEEVEA